MDGYFSWFYFGNLKTDCPADSNDYITFRGNKPKLYYKEPIFMCVSKISQ